jgi:hypothetical protein
MNDQTTQSSLIRNLMDAGCDADFIDQFIAMTTSPPNQETHSQLREWRNCLLDEIHSNQHKLDCLDYLLRKLGS